MTFIFGINKKGRCRKKKLRLCWGRITRMWNCQRRCYTLIWQKYDLSDNSEALVYEWAQLAAGLLWCLQTLLLWEKWNKIQLELLFKSHILLKAYWTTAPYKSGTARERNTYFLSRAKRNRHFCPSIYWFCCTMCHWTKNCVLLRCRKDTF